VYNHIVQIIEIFIIFASGVSQEKFFSDFAKNNFTHCVHIWETNRKIIMDSSKIQQNTRKLESEVLDEYAQMAELLNRVCPHEQSNCST
jgi:pantothenate kinase